MKHPALRLPLLAAALALAAPAWSQSPNPPPNDDDIHEPLEPGTYRTGYGTSAESNQWYPFDRASVAALRGASRKVFAHYFLYPIHLNTHNEDPAADPYTTAYLEPGGNVPGSDPVDGDPASSSWFSGGTFRERPLPRSQDYGANFMVEVMKTEIRRAIAIGLDGFAVEINCNTVDPTDVDWKRITNLLAAASDSAVNPGYGFKIMLQPDMAIQAGWTQAQLTAVVDNLADTYSNAVFKVGAAPAKVVVCPFRADGALYPASWWNSWVSSVQSTVPVAFVPMPLAAFPTTFYDSVKDSCYGFSSWGVSFWDAHNIGGTLDTAALNVHSNNGGNFGANKIWMHPVGPQDFRPKNRIYWEAANTRRFRLNWENGAIGATAQPPINTGDWADWVEFTTWNDNSESSGMAPGTGTQTLFYDLAAYYIQWFKLGSPPAIVRDCIYYSHRQHHSSAVPSSYSTEDRYYQSGPFVLKSASSTTVKDDIEGLFFLTAPADVQIEYPAGVFSTETVADVPAGGIRYTKYIPVPSGPGAQGQPKFRIIRGGKTVAYVESRFPINNTIVHQNLVYNGGSSLREPVPQITQFGGWGADAHWPLNPDVLPGQLPNPPWVTWDIGAPAPGCHGSADSSSGTWTIVGGGAEIGPGTGANDQFRYVYRTWSGDFSYVVKVASQSGSDPWAKSGIMVRETDAPGAKDVMLVVTPGNGVRFRYRTATGGATTGTGWTGSDLWIKLVRSGSTFTAYRSPNGTTWTQLGTPQSVPMSSTLVGLAVCSHDNASLNEVKFTNANLSAP